MAGDAVDNEVAGPDDEEMDKLLVGKQRQNVINIRLRD